jgi:hypothetical protein
VHVSTDTQPVDNKRDQLASEVRRKSLELSVEVEVFYDGDIGEESLLLRAVAQPIADVLEVFLQVKAKQTDRASGWLHGVGQALEGGALASPVDAEEGEALALGYGK